MMAVHFNLPTESRDGKIDRPCEYLRVQISPNRTEQFIAVDHNVATFGEVAQEFELAVRKRDCALSAQGLFVQKVNRHGSEAYTADAGPCAPKHRTNARQQFLRIERFVM
jgi:hypothetical protein